MHYNIVTMKNVRQIVSVSDNGKGTQEGVMLDCGHWQHMPTGVRVDWSSSFLKFMSGVSKGIKFYPCKQCADEWRNNNG